MNRLSEYSQNLGALLEIPIKVTVELGSCHRYAREVLGLGPGTVVEFDQAGDGLANLYVNQTLVARGELITSESGSGIKITEVIRQQSGNDSVESTRGSVRTPDEPASR